MRRSGKFAGTIALLFALVHSSGTASPPVRLKLVVPAGYLPQIPVLVRVEALNAQGGAERMLWNAEADRKSNV